MKPKNNILRSLGFIALAFASNTAHATSYTWNTNTSGASWSASGSWVDNAVPTFVAGDTFDLSTLNITVNGTTSSMDTVGGNTLGTIKLGDTNNTHTWTLSLSTALTLDGNGSAAAINQVSTSKGDTINGAGGIVLASDLNTANASGNVLQITTGITATGGTRTITNNGSGGARVNFNNAIGSGINLVQNSTTSETWMNAGSASFDGTITVKAGGFEVGATGANGIALGTASFTLGDTSGSSDAYLWLKSGNGSGYNAPINVASGSSGIKSILGVVTNGNNSYALNGAITLGSNSSNTADLTIGNSTASTSTYNVNGGVTGFGNVTVKNTSSGKTVFGTVSPNNTGTITNAGTGTGLAQFNAVIGTNVTGVVQNSSTSGMFLNAINTYTGGTTVDAGTLQLGKGGSAGTIRGTLTINSGTVVNLTAADALGYTVGTKVDTVNINGGTLNNALNGNNGYQTNFVLTGGTMAETVATTGNFGYNFDSGFGISTLASATTSTVSGRLVIRGGALGFNVADGAAATDLLVSGAILTNGGSGITKSGAGMMTLTGANTYAGDTTVIAGVLAVNGTSIADANKLVIDGGKVDVAGTEVVGTLFFGGVQQANGLWGSTSSSAPPAHQDDSRFTGTGVVSVGPASGYSTWATTNVGGQAPDEDYNNDGVDNGIAYFMNNTGIITLPGIVGGAVTWTNGGNIPTSAYATQFRVQTSPDLVNWTPVESGDLTTNTSGPGGSLTYTLPTGQGKFFVRLTVTPQ